MKDSKMSLAKCIDIKCNPETSIVLRYINAFKFGITDEEDSKYKEWFK